jgi:hypothetical protein
LALAMTVTAARAGQCGDDCDCIDRTWLVAEAAVAEENQRRVEWEYGQPGTMGGGGVRFH